MPQILVETFRQNETGKEMVMKNRIKTVLGVCTLLMMCAGCALFKTDRERNEVVSRLDEEKNTFWGYGSFGLTCIEQTTASADNGLKISDVCIQYPSYMLQMYRIEGDKVVNYHWSDHLLYGVYYLQDDNTQRAAWDECQALIDKIWAMRKAQKQLPNRAGQSETFPQPQEKGSIVTVTHIELTGNSFKDAKGIVHLRNLWAARQWAGTPNDVPAEIEAFRQNALQAVSVPEYRGYYSSYVRAIPLLTKEALEAEQDTPLLGRGQRYHVKAALQYPYLLIPVPEGRPPVSITGYKPGDKFKFKVLQDCNGEPCYFLIETFKGEAGKNPSRRAFKRPYNPIP